MTVCVQLFIDLATPLDRNVVIILNNVDVTAIGQHTIITSFFLIIKKIIQQGNNDTINEKFYNY